MGIVAHCPNGHRIKVKDHFAGKKVLCPDCGARFRVAAAGSTATTAAGLLEARFVPLDPAVVATLPRAFALDAGADPHPRATLPPTPIVGVPLTAAAPDAVFSDAMFSHPVVSEPVFLDLPSVDPAPAWHPRIAEQPLASWCLSRPGGEPGPPMTAADMQHWLDSRASTGDELVWRSDWPEWLPIAAVFPEYMPPATM